MDVGCEGRAGECDGVVCGAGVCEDLWFEHTCRCPPGGFFCFVFVFLFVCLFVCCMKRLSCISRGF